MDYILCGMQFGDEGKGSFTDYLTYKNNGIVVKYNGGCQASHTVTHPFCMTHKFSQLGSGMFHNCCSTFITENMVINLDSLLVELGIFSYHAVISEEELLKRIFIHEDCYVVTPYHKMINRLREMVSGNKKRGTVGTGVSEVKYLLKEIGIGIQIKDIYPLSDKSVTYKKFKQMQEYLSNFYENNKKSIKKLLPKYKEFYIKEELKILLKKDFYIKIADMYIQSLNNIPKYCIYSDYKDVTRKLENPSIIYEGSQGLLIDAEYGLKPNTTFLDTTNHYADKLSEKLVRKAVKIGIIKAFMSRHGPGVFPTEYDFGEIIKDNNQEESIWNGKIRFGWSDMVLLRYAQKINKVDKLYMSAVDILSKLDSVKICNSYIYCGIPDDLFNKIFEYHKTDEKIIITNIKQPDKSLGKYLKKCKPFYITMDGWNNDIAWSEIESYNNLPKNCKKYIEMIEKLAGIKVSVISIGPTYMDKIEKEM